ncbi:NAD-dependent epimerase/dehydratase family protein [Bradyrhizobium sp. SZCCHNRI1003]|uniref:NAD-dependent epimerase/dehydratase family protein n=1 Tax=Bradyrhizobium sp. SZCCHNRI1003 TaxID=3057275 RepID=UPI002915FF3F|nr:NAD-dependent epimerase/dehydratase family protein [Bradyrhizobium sp. SZCCHNRI1003]
MNLFVIGLGYTAGRFVQHYGDRFAHTSGTVRTEEKRARLAPIELDLFDGTTAAAETIAKAARADVILISVPPGPADDPVLGAFGRAIADGNARRVIYLSTIGVYADHQGDWIDEDTPLAPEHDRVKARVQVEAQWRARLGDRLAVLRLGGIYGPGRNALVELRAGRARRIVKPGQVFNRIHVDDAAAAIMGAIAPKAGGTWNICDDEPAPPQDVIAYAASLMGVAAPPEQPFETAELSPMARSFYASNRRVRNIRAKRDLALRLRYPNYRAGLDALWAAGEGQP